MQCHLQDMRQEEIDGMVMHDTIGQYVKMYRDANGGRAPSKVVVYRDGVSESQYQMVSVVRSLG